MFGPYYTMSAPKPQDRDLSFFPVFQVEIPAPFCYNSEKRIRRAIESRRAAARRAIESMQRRKARHKIPLRRKRWNPLAPQAAP